MASRKDRPFLWLAIESKVGSVVGAGLIDNRSCFFNLLDNFGGIEGVNAAILLLESRRVVW